MAKIRQYNFVVGSETNSAPVAGTPSASSDLVTLQYLQDNYSADTEWSASVDDVTQLKAIAAVNRADQQVIAVESTRGLWQFESGASDSGDDYFVATPAAGTGRWYSMWNRFKDFSAAFFLKLKVDSSLTADRILTVDVNDADRTIDLSGNLTVSGAATISGTSSGTNTGDQTITLTSDVTGSGTGSFATTIANDAVTNAKLANMATQTIKGRTTAGTGDPEDLTSAQATAILSNFVGDSGSGGTKGLVPAPSAGDGAAGKFLNATGVWAVPSGGGGSGGGGFVQWNADGSDAPISATEFNNQVYLFEDGASQNLYCTIKVPETYTPGNQIKMYVSHYHQAASATQLLLAQSTLIPHGTAFDNTTNQRTTTNSAQSGASKALIKATLDISSATGQINGVSIAAGDLIKVRLYRGTDTSTSDISMIPSTTEVTFS